MSQWLPRVARDLSLPTFYGVTSRGVVPPGLTSAHGCSASIDLAGGVDTAGGGRALARHPRHQDRHQDGPERHSTHPSPSVWGTNIYSTLNNTCNVIICVLFQQHTIHSTQHTRQEVREEVREEVMRIWRKTNNEEKYFVLCTGLDEFRTVAN